MWKKLVKYVVRYLDVWFHPPISREKALEIAKEECARRGWRYGAGAVEVERYGWSLWMVMPLGRPYSGRQLILIYIRVLDGTIKNASNSGH
jgi:hypothetical protein